MIEVLFQLLFLLILFVFLGEPLRAFIFKKISIFSGLDLIQIGMLDVFIGGMLLYLLALLPFGLFSWSILVGYTVLSIVLSFLLHSKKIFNYCNIVRLTALVQKNKKQLCVYLSVFMIFVIFLSINLSSLSGLIFGSVRDESIHSLYTQVIIENHSLTSTLQPYLPEGIIYPQAAHIIFAYSTYMLNMDVPQVVLYVSVLFKSLSIFGAYFLGKKLGNSFAYGVSLCFVTAFISSWPLNVTWGANPFLIGFPLFFVCLGILLSLYRKRDMVSLAVAGLMFGYTGAVILSYLEALMLLVCLVFVYYIVMHRRKILASIGSLAIVLSVSLIPLIPFLYQFIKLYNYPGHNVGLPADISNWASQQYYFSQALDWAINNLSPFLIPRILIVLIIGSFVILLLITKDYKKLNDTILSISRFALAIFASSIILSFVSFFLPGDFNIVSWGHQGIILSIPISILIVVSYMKFAEFLREGRFKPLSKFFFKNSKAILLIIIAALSLVTAPFLYYRFAADSQNLRGAYDIYAVTTQQDYDLMQWMKANLKLSNDDALILVHPYSSGLFLPSVSNNKIIYPYTASAMSFSYTTLVSLLENATLNSEAYQTMRNLNVSYIFVSSEVVQTDPQSPKWEPTLFLGNPNFGIVKNFNDSYLFEIKGYDSTVVYLDDFEYPVWDQNYWQNNYTGWGSGNVTTATNGAFASKALTITSQAESLVGNCNISYSNNVKRELFIGNQSSVNLSFDLDAIEGFNGNDTFALLVSNINQTQTIVIATPNNIFQNYTHTETLQRYSGSFNFNLSEIWQNANGLPLPSKIILTLGNYDFDGSCNVAQVDNILVNSTSTSAP